MEKKIKDYKCTNNDMQHVTVSFDWVVQEINLSRQEVQLTLRITANKLLGVTWVHLQHLDRASTHKHAHLWNAEHEWETESRWNKHWYTPCMKARIKYLFLSSSVPQFDGSVMRCWDDEALCKPQVHSLCLCVPTDQSHNHLSEPMTAWLTRSLYLWENIRILAGSSLSPRWTD